MARHEIDITITDEGRDQGKVFHLREMPATQTEDWALSALSLLARSGVDLGEIGNKGMLGMAVMGFDALLKIDMAEARPLLAELMTCVTIQPDPNNPAIVRRLDEEDIEEVGTLIRLKVEAFKLHANFLKGVSTSGSTSKPTTETTYIPDSPPTKTSPQQSPQFSQSARTKRPR